jgi:hypothetical protein
VTKLFMLSQLDFSVFHDPDSGRKCTFGAKISISSIRFKKALIVFCPR